MTNIIINIIKSIKVKEQIWLKRVTTNWKVDLKKSHIIQPRDRNRKYKRVRPKGQSKTVCYLCEQSDIRGEKQ